jgi:voltage-gated potassium channel
MRFLRLLGLARLAILLRLLRIARLGVIARSLVDANRATSQLAWMSNRNGLPTLILIAVGLLWIGAAAAYEFEHGFNPQFATFGDAFWWAFSTMATLGYGAGPQSVPGRVVAAVLMALGIAIFGALTATFAAFVVQRSRAEQQVPSDDLAEMLRDIQTRMARLEDRLTDTRNPDVASWRESSQPPG